MDRNTRWDPVDDDARKNPVRLIFSVDATYKNGARGVRNNPLQVCFVVSSYKITQISIRKRST